MGRIKWVGFYTNIAVPRRMAFDPWTGKYQFIRRLGLGLAILYVGRQQAGCGGDSLSRDQGVADGADTIEKVGREGFPANAIVFLDVERFDGGLSDRMKDYYQGWISAILDGGTIEPHGTYCADGNASRPH